MLQFPVCHWGGGADLVKNILNTYGIRSSAPIGVVDGKAGTLAFWGKITSAGILYITLNGSNKATMLAMVSFGGFGARLEMRNTVSGVGKVIDASGITNTHIDGLNVWAWYGFSWNTGAARAAMFLNDTDVQDHGSFFSRDKTVNYTAASHTLYASNSGVANLRGCFKHVYLNFGVEYDFSIEANRRLFIDAAGQPVEPPSGNIVLLKGDPSDNSSGGGNFTIVNGPFEFCEDSP